MKMNNIRILITDDHPMFRHGIRQLLSGQPEIKRIDEASSGNETLEMLKKQDFDIVIMDIKMPGLSGIDTTREIKRKHPNVRVLAISMYDEHPYIVKMMKAGAMGYLLKNSRKEDLMCAIERVMEGERYFSEEVANIMMTGIVEGKRIYDTEDDFDVTLTKRELEIISMIAEEMTNVEIGERLDISPRTVDTHRRNLLQKLKVKNTAGLVKFAMRNNLLD